MKLPDPDSTLRIMKIIHILRQSTQAYVQPASITLVKQYGRDPFLVLASCLLSLRTKDTVSLPASQRLFEYAKTPQEMLKVPLAILEKVIYPVGFYRQKARTLHHISAELLARFNGQVPETFQELISLKGVGPKTANLVLAEGFNIPAICVDTHVHRISNRLGIVKTSTPEETERELKKILPQEYWREWSSLMVMWGQNICMPVSPFCSKCPIVDLCPKVGVKKRR
ncbi:MAG: endonuclease III [Candidatus Dependentiae bacterium]|nr:endonuclease III [Candidatus Dependentiae bacterium]